MYRGFFVNLARSDARREAMLRRIADIGGADRYSRFEAVDGREVADRFPTTLSPGELGIWLTTLEILRQNVATDLHLHVVEDDIVFARDAVGQFDSILDAMDRQMPWWDIAFTELMVPPHASQLREMIVESRDCRARGVTAVLNIGGWNFAGFTSYFVNRRSVAKLLSLLDGGWVRGGAVDLYVRTLIHAGSVAGYATVPFLTSLAPQNDESEIRGALDRSRASTDFLRRAFFADADTGELFRRCAEFHRDVAVDDLTNIALYAQLFYLSDQWQTF